MMPSRRFTPEGSLPPSCKYLWTASRPVNTTPDISTSSPTFRVRTFSSVKGKVSLIMIASINQVDRLVNSRSIEPFLNICLRVQNHPLAAIGPAHVTDADKERCGHAIGRAYFHAQQCGLAAKPHGTDAEVIGGFQNILFQRVQLRN